MQAMKQMQAPVNVVGSSIFGRYPKISSEKTYNMFISDEWLVSFAGWKKVIDLLPVEESQGRGAFRSIRNNIVVVVVNSSVFILDTSLTQTFIGNLDTSVGDVFMDENLNNQICIVDGVNAYIYNFKLGTLTKQTLGSTLIPNYVCYHNTFFLFGNGDTSSNGAAWYAYSYATDTTITETTQLALQTKSDYAIAVQRLPGGGNNVLVFGTAVTELWTQVGGLQNYQRNISFNIDYGCLSVSTIASSDKYVIWLGINESNSPVITLFSGKQAQSISTDGIDYQLGLLQYPEQSTAFFYRGDGHLFYQITFYNPNDNLSLIYDVDTQKFFHLSDAHLNYHPARRIVYLNNDIYFVSLNNGSFYKTNTDLTTYNENIGENIGNDDPDINKEIPRIRICSNIRKSDSGQFRSRNLRITIDQGNDPYVSILSLTEALNDIITEDSEIIITETGGAVVMEGTLYGSIPYCPKVDLTISTDGGVAFSNTVTINLNPEGIRQNILSWQRQFGICNDLIFKFRFWGRSYWAVYNGTLDIY